MGTHSTYNPPPKIPGCPACKPLTTPSSAWDNFPFLPLDLDH